MISSFDYTYVFLCIAFALVRLGHRVFHLLFLNDLSEARFEKRAIRLTGFGLCHDRNTNPDFTGAPFLTFRPSAYSESIVTIPKLGQVAYPI